MKQPDLDYLVALARRDRPPPGVWSTVARNLRLPFIAAPVGVATLASTAAVAAASKLGLSRLALWGWGGGTAVVASSLALAVVLGRSPTPPPSVPPHVATPTAQRTELPVTPPTPEPLAPAAEAPSAPPALLRAVKEAPASWDEPQLIERARRALATDGRRAFALSQEHQRRFPSGALSAERDLIAVEALARLGQSAEAKRRALAFEAKYPRSIHLPRVQALLARLGGG